MKTLTMWQKMAGQPLGKWAFSRLVCFKAPYFSSIRPQFVELRPGHSEITIAKRRAVQNHIGTVHAIAICNMAELVAGTMTDVTIPKTHRWIPKSMRVEYLNKAATDLRAVAKPVNDDLSEVDGDYVVHVEVKDTQGTIVLEAFITMWVTERPAR